MIMIGDMLMSRKSLLSSSIPLKEEMELSADGSDKALDEVSQLRRGQKTFLYCIRDPRQTRNWDFLRKVNRIQIRERKRGRKR